MQPSEYSAIKHLAQQLLHLEKAGLPQSCELLNKLNDIAGKTSKVMEATTGQFLRDDLDDEKYTRGHIKGLIDAFPKTLSITGEGGRLPIFNAAYKFQTISFVPLLAQEGSIRDVCGEHSRGGLLVHRGKTLKALVHTPKFSNERYDAKVFQVLKDLKDLGLLQKEDVKRYGLLYETVEYRAQKSFDFLAQLDPEALKEEVGTYGPFIHRVIRLYSLERFAMVLKTSVKLFPNDMGLLFDKTSTSMTAFDVASGRYGVNSTMKVVRECIPPSDNYPILHHVIQHVPQQMNVFVTHYPEAAYVRNADNRTLFLSTLASGNKTFCEDPIYFLKASDDEVGEMDPVTELFPFALAASGNSSDLMTVYKLLRRAPDLVLGGRLNRKGRKKRRRGVRGIRHNMSFTCL